MKTQKLALSAVLATTLFSTAAFADIPVQGDSATTGPTINVSLTIAKRCNIVGLEASQNAPISDSTKTYSLDDVYADCNTGTAPTIVFTSSTITDKNEFVLTNGTETIPYTIKLGTTAVTAGKDVKLPTAIGSSLVFTASYTQAKGKPTAGEYKDTVTTTITL